ncbi:MAG: hypothetical protein ACPHJ0_05955, partial [Arenicellales bacterium]
MFRIGRESRGIGRWAQLTTSGSVVKVRAPGWSAPAGQKLFFAEVAELVDALASGASGGNPV